MRYVCAGVLLAFALMAAGRQQRTPQLPGATPQTVPQPDKDVGRQMPPDTRAKAPSSDDVQKQIQDKMDSEPGLADAKLKARVSSSSVVLSGTVGNETQRTAAQRIAESYAGPRKIVDNIRVRR